MSALRTPQSEINHPSGPVWAVAELFPYQGEWTPESYLELTADTNRLIEFTNGRLEFLPMPELPHQRIMRLLMRLFDTFVETRQLGEVFFSPVRVRVSAEKFREPDLVFIHRDHIDRNRSYCTIADLVLEVVSEGGRKRDLVEKRVDYAEGRVPEYWIVDPQEGRIEVLRLKDGAYVTHGEFKRGQQATSVVLEGLCVDVGAVMDLAIE